MSRTGAACAALIAFAAATPALAEDPKDTTWTLSAEARVRGEYRDNFDLESDVDDDLRLWLMRLRLGAEFAWRNEVKVFAQIQDSRTAGEEVSTASNEENVDLHQGYVDLSPVAWHRVSLRFGRQEWIYGDERLIGAFAWDNVGRSFDGVRARWSVSQWTLDGLMARVSSRLTPVTTPPIAPPETGSSATTGSDLFGIYAHWAQGLIDELDLYWLEFADHAAAPGELAGTSGTSRIDAFGVRGRENAGQFDVVFEVVGETGEAGGDDLAAAAAAIQIGWTFGNAVRTRLFAGYDYATGDEDPDDGEREEFFNFFPTNHPYYGYADLMGWRNLESPSIGVSVRGGQHFGLVKGMVFDLESESGPWKSAGGAVLGFDPAGASGSRVGTEIDLLYRYAWLESVTVEAGFARFDPGDFAAATRGPDVQNWAYVMLMARL